MVANLDYSKGYAAMAYVGDIPWHREGQKLDDNASFEDWLKAAGMDWTIESSPVQYQVGEETRIWDNRQVFYRSDNGEPLSAMSQRYKVVQPKEALEFIAELCNDFGFKMETAGCLAGGTKLWAMCRNGPDVEIVGDQFRQYVHISTAIDGSLATTVDDTFVRIVCANTIRAALSDSSGKRVKVKHSTTFDPAIVREAIGLADFQVATKAFAEIMENLAAINVSPKQAEMFYANLLRPNKESVRENKDGSIPQIRGAEDLWLAYTSAPGAVPGTAYGLIQGLTYWLDHVRGRDEKRLESAWYGQGSRLKEQAIAQATQLAA